MRLKWPLRSHGLHRWIAPYVMQRRRRHDPPPGSPVHVLLCIADHFEPKHGGASARHAAERVEAWVNTYPRLFDGFRDSDGRPPQHTFFFPIDEYEPSHVEELATLCREGYGEVEIHHHHDNDTANALRDRLLYFKQVFHEEHGLLARDRTTGVIKYGFVHGNWALDNCRPDGRWCGVNNELDILRETGCYADFTFPSAPSDTQPAKINSIYYAVDDPHRPNSHNTGVDAGTAPQPENSLMLIQGPLVLNWRARTGPARLMPRIENGNLQGNQPPTMQRLDLWLRASVQVPQRPDWHFVKLHTHGAIESNRRMLLGGGMLQLHEGLRERARRSECFHFHYVTARQMYNLARAAASGYRGSIVDARDYELTSSGAMEPSELLLAN